MERVVKIEELSKLSGLPVRSIRTLMYRGVIPHIRLGHRSVVFQPSQVERALKKRTVKELG